MHVPDLTRHRQVIADKPTHTGHSLQVELECIAQIGWANPSRSDSRADIQKWNPRGPRCKVVTQMRSQADYPFAFWRILSATPQFKAPFEIASIPMTLPQNTTQHV